MADSRNHDVIQRLATLYRESKTQKLSLDKVDDELRWILTNRHLAPNFNGQSINNLWTILINYNYGYKTHRVNPTTTANLMHPIAKDIWLELLAATMKEMNNITKDELKNLFSIFHRMNIWQNIDSEFEKLRDEIIHRVNYLFETLDITLTLRVLMNLGCQWYDLLKPMRTDVINKVLQLNEQNKSQELLDLLWICVSLGMPNDIFYSQEKALIAEKLQEIVVVKLDVLEKSPSIGTEGSSWVNTTSALRQMQQIRLYFQLPIDTDCGDKLDQALESIIKTELSLSSKNYATFQDSVLRVIKKISKEYGVEYIEEATPLHVKPVDVYFPQHKIILELNGPHHYNLHGLIRPNDIRNKNIYEVNGYQVVSIKQSEWNLEKDKYQFILNMLHSLGIVSEEKSDIRKDNNNDNKANKTHNNNSFYSPPLKSTENPTLPATKPTTKKGK